MSLRVIITPSAASDLADIWEYLAQNSVEAADRFLSQVRDQADLTASHPGRGERDSRVGACRRFLVGPYLVFYQATENGLRVLRVYHSARRIEDLAFPDEHD